MTRIVVLDGYTTNPGDLSWEPLSRLGDLAVYDRTPKEFVLDRAAGADVLLTNKTLFPARVIAALPSVRYIGCMSTGYNVVDLEEAQRRGITVTNVPEYATFATAQMTIALILELTNHVGSHNQHVHEGAWSQSVDFCFTDGPMTELFGKTLGLIGYGRIAQRTARIASALGMRVLATSRSIEARMHHENLADMSPDIENPDVNLTNLPTLLRESDIISCHCPLTPETRHLVSVDTIAKMKDGALIINTSRGPVLDESAVADALIAGKLGGVAVDVLSHEPPNEDNPLLTAPNCIITPHIAWAPKETRSRLLDTVAGNLEAYLEGRPRNTVC